jgi:hypothetical protein
MHASEVYRVKAAEMRKLASTARDRVAFDELLRLAAEYDRLAESAEAEDGNC